MSDQPVLEPEPGTWSELLVEVGPPPVLLDNGLICLVCNAAVKLPEGGVRYVCGQALFDPADPTRPVAKLDRPWLEPRTVEEGFGGSALPMTSEQRTALASARPADRPAGQGRARGC